MYIDAFPVHIAESNMNGGLVKYTLRLRVRLKINQIYAAKFRFTAYYPGSA